MKLPLPEIAEVEQASTVTLLRWWCLAPMDPEETMCVEEAIRVRLAETKADHLATIENATGLGFDGG